MLMPREGALEIYSWITIRGRRWSAAGSEV